MGEQAGGALTNSIVELCFTSSVRFLQPGLLLQVARRTASAFWWLLSAPIFKAPRCPDSDHASTEFVLQGAAGVMDEGGGGIDGMAGRPRKSWQMRKRQERAAIKEGLAEWQARTVAVTALVCIYRPRRACPGRRARSKSALASSKALPSGRWPFLL